MILALRTDQPEASLQLISNGAIVKELKWQAHRELADTLLSKLSELLKSSKVQMKDLKGIIMHTGEGSFTGLRIGTSLANGLSYGLNIPIVSAGGEDWISKGLKTITTAKLGEYVIPSYSAEPNITEPKKQPQ